MIFVLIFESERAGENADTALSGSVNLNWFLVHAES